jgi:dTDP-4-amino-4,6-dideoxygalactose transaminase
MIFVSNPTPQFKHYEAEIMLEIKSVLNSNSYILGKQVENLEKNFAIYIESKFGIGVNSGTDALILALKALGIGKGDEVITVSHTALATIAAIIATGATPVLVDIEPDFYTINANLIEEVITKNTKAIIAVHLYGQSCDLEAIINIAKNYNIFLIEDCAQSTGGEYKEKKLGSFGEISCFSFYPTKNLGAIGDGGMVLTNSSDVHIKISTLRQYGWDANRNTIEPGINSRLDEIQAAILNVKLKYLDQDNNRRIEIAEMYTKALSNSNLILPSVRPNTKHVFHLYVIKSENRDYLKSKLLEKGIYAGIHYLNPCHLNNGYERICKIPKNNLPVTNSTVRDILSLPIYPELTNKEVEYIIESILN